MKILGIDPGYERLGIAVIEKEKGKEKLLYSTCFKTPKTDSFYKRLLALGKKVEEVIQKYDVDTLSIETLFLNTNQKTVMRVSEVRGAIILEAAKANLDIYEYTPLQIKIALTGYGRGTKDQVAFMVQRLLNLKDDKKLDDEYDAIAAALTCSACVK